MVSNKKKEIRIGKKLKDRTQYPLYLVLPEYNAKMHMMLSAKNDMFKLYVNGMEYLSLPYKYDLVPEGDKSIKFNGIVKFDEKQITIPLPWSNRAFVTNFQDALPKNQ